MSLGLCRMQATRWHAAATVNLLLLCIIQLEKKKRQTFVEIGEIKQIRNKTEKTCTTIQQQHIRTSHSSCTLLFVRIASAMARAPSAPI